MPQHRRPDEEVEPDDTAGRPLSMAERKALRRIIENEHRIQWFWGSVRVWAGWIAAAIIGAWSLIEIGSKIWKRTL